jgi:hypothetical protein
LEVEGRGASTGLEFQFEVWAVGSSLEEGVRRLGPALAALVVSIIWISSSLRSRVRSMGLLWTLSFAAFSASLWASAPDAQAVLSRFLRSAA